MGPTNQLQIILAVVASIALFVGFGAAALFLFRGYEALARRSLRKKYAGLEVLAIPQAGDVFLAYDTYHGFLAWCTPMPHHVALPPDDARKLLGRLLRFNLLWGLLCPGVVFIPLLAICNYLAQRRSIAAQETREKVALAARQPFLIPDQSESIQPGPRPVYPEGHGSRVAETMSPPPTRPSPSPESSPASLPVSRDAEDLVIRQPRSLLHRIFGWIAAGLTVLFAITTVVALVQGHPEAVLGGVFATALFGWVAQDWIGPSLTTFLKRKRP
jgi:hypothetical protein